MVSVAGRPYSISYCDFLPGFANVETLLSIMFDQNRAPPTDRRWPAMYGWGKSMPHQCMLLWLCLQVQALLHDAVLLGVSGVVDSCLMQWLSHSF